jgi:hypothetical protein
VKKERDDDELDGSNRCLPFVEARVTLVTDTLLHAPNGIRTFILSTLVSTGPAQVRDCPGKLSDTRRRSMSPVGRKQT